MKVLLTLEGRCTLHSQLPSLQEDGASIPCSPNLKFLLTEEVDKGLSQLFILEQSEPRLGGRREIGGSKSLGRMYVERSEGYGL